MLDKHIEQLTRARVSMLLHAPFFGNLATRLLLKDATDWCATAATDGRYFYYNRDFLDKLNKKETIFLMGHEVMHSVFDHMGRRGSRDAKIWNCAADYVINWELHEQKIGTIPDPKTSGVTACYDPKFKGMCSEEVYEELYKNAKMYSFDEFDVHLTPGGGQGEELSDEEREMLRDEIRQAVMQAAKAAGADKTPGSVKRMIQELTDPQMDWRDLLDMQIQSIIKSDYTWSRQSRKSQSSGYYLPAQKNDVRIEVSIAIDTSGSMGADMLKDLLSEVKGIMEQFPDFILNLWCFDTSVHNFQSFTPDNMDDIDSYKIMGGGGTIFQVNWDYMKANEIEPARFLCFTDGEDSGNFGLEDEAYCETIFLIHSDPHRRIDCKHGTHVWYEGK